MGAVVGAATPEALERNEIDPDSPEGARAGNLPKPNRGAGAGIDLVEGTDGVGDLAAGQPAPSKEIKTSEGMSFFIMTVKDYVSCTDGAIACPMTAGNTRRIFFT